MKTSLAIATVLLAGVALEAAAYRINDNVNQRNGDKGWFRYQQGDSNSNSDVGYTSNGPYDNQYENNDHLNANNAAADYNDRFGQYGQFEESSYGSRSGEQRHGYDNQVSVDHSAGLTAKMVEKIAALHKIALRHGIGENDNNGLEAALTVQQNTVKLPAQSEFVTFLNATMKNLDNGDLQYMYISPDRDVVFAQFDFDRIETAGSFKSNVHGAKSGYFTIVLYKVTSNVSTSFDGQHPVIRPAEYHHADAAVKTVDGANTAVFDDVLEKRYLRVLEQVVSAATLKFTNQNMIEQMKSQIRKPISTNDNHNDDVANGGKLYSMQWKEDDLTMGMSFIGFQNPGQAEPKIKYVSFHRNANNTYSMRYYLTLTGLQWTTDLFVESSGNRMNARSVNFNIDNVDVQVTVTRTYGQQQQSCGEFDADVKVRGLQYNLNDNELMSKVQSKLPRFIQHSFEAYVEEALKQEICSKINL